MGVRGSRIGCRGNSAGCGDPPHYRPSVGDPGFVEFIRVFKGDCGRFVHKGTAFVGCTPQPWGEEGEMREAVSNLSWRFPPRAAGSGACSPVPLPVQCYQTVLVRRPSLEVPGHICTARKHACWVTNAKKMVLRCDSSCSMSRTALSQELSATEIPSFTPKSPF